jgi:amino acid adenylation domain-containing protein
MSDLSERIGNLSPEQRELLKRLLADEEPRTALKRAPRERSMVALPTSFGQQRLWFLDRLEPGGSSYNIFDAIAFSGPLNVRALSDSVNEVVRRHESLRTSFGAVDGAPVQIIAETLDLKLPVIDLSPLEPAEREAETARLMAEEAVRPFDLAQGPLLRTTLLRFDDNEHLFLLNMHHIISDAWSLEVFNRELHALYEAYRTGGSSPLPELPLQYADFAIWQRQSLTGEALARQLAYWKDRLDGAPRILELPMDHPRPPLQAYKGARQAITLRTTLTEALRALGLSEGVTLFMTMLTAFNVLLFRYTEQEDLVVGTPIANRTRAELEDLIGFFINMLVLRVDLSGDPSFRGLLARVREVALGAYAHQDLPFEMLVSELHPERDMSRNPLFQVTFQLTKAAGAGEGTTKDDLREIADSQSAPELSTRVEAVAAKFDLLFNVWDNGSELEVQADYNTDLFDDTTIARLLDHYRVILNGATANPDQRLSLISLLTPEEEQQILLDWNDTDAAYPRDTCLHELFESISARSPQSIAVSFGGEQLTYRELNERSNQAAWYLRRLGVGPEVRVGICTEHSVEMVVGMLGILKAGGAYVPLDPDYPRERLTFMLEDAGVSILVTQRHLVQVFPQFQGVVLCLDTDLKIFESESKANLRAGALPENLAYVIYSSGSTGRPKGIGVPHRAVTRLVCNTNYIELAATDRVVQASNTSFDATTFEVWGTLLHGAQLVGIAKEAVLSPQRLAAHIREHAISVMFLPTSLFNQVAGEIPDAFNSVHTLLFGGEAANVARTREVLAAGLPGRLLNVYGPTEGTTFSSWLEIEDVPEAALRIPIGRPVSNTLLYVLDRQQQPVPVAVTGELYIGGEGLARGYVGAPELTAERFLPDAFSGSAGTRMYRTGDMVRYLANGAVEFLGRRDGQVKVRGFRVELGEVEAALRADEAVRDAVVVARADQTGNQGLAAYVVAANGNGERVSVGDLREHLKRRLPDYMVPAAFVLLDELPLNANGKLDKRALPDPKLFETERETTFTAPRTPVEEKLTEVFASVLSLKSVSIDDNFFDLGGHSLIATQVISRIRQLFQVEVSLLSLFVTRTVADLAEVIEEELKNGKNAVVPAITRVSRAGFRASISPDGSLKMDDVLKTTLGG